ncbi:MAG TPA: hypothetical protein VF656_02390 [Pyrinomonadaceae bacterium]|jgi:hypothetical protein
MNALMFLLLVVVPPLIIIQIVSAWERDGYRSNSWWGFLGWATGAVTSGIMLMPVLWFLPLLAMFLHLVYTSLWGLATAKIINGIGIKTSWSPSGFGRALIGLMVGFIVATSLTYLDGYLTQDLQSPPLQLCIFIVGMASGCGAGMMSRPCDARPYD